MINMIDSNIEVFNGNRLNAHAERTKDVDSGLVQFMDFQPDLSMAYPYDPRYFDFTNNRNIYWDDESISFIPETQVPSYVDLANQRVDTNNIFECTSFQPSFYTQSFIPEDTYDNPVTVSDDGSSNQAAVFNGAQCDKNVLLDCEKSHEEFDPLVVLNYNRLNQPLMRQPEECFHGEEKYFQPERAAQSKLQVTNSHQHPVVNFVEDNQCLRQELVNSQFINSPNAMDVPLNLTKHPFYEDNIMLTAGPSQSVTNTNRRRAVLDSIHSSDTFENCLVDQNRTSIDNTKKSGQSEDFYHDIYDAHAYGSCNNNIIFRSLNSDPSPQSDFRHQITRSNINLSVPSNKVLPEDAKSSLDSLSTIPTSLGVDKKHRIRKKRVSRVRNKLREMKLKCENYKIFNDESLKDKLKLLELFGASPLACKE